MFFKDDQGILSCQLGTGDVAVSECNLKGIPPEKCVAVVFGQCKEGKINRELPELTGKLDYEIGVKFKLLFTNPKSIDVVIAELEQAKDLMNGKEKNDSSSTAL